MMSNPFQTPAFKRLLAEWNARLAAEGFEDAEPAGPDARMRFSESTLVVSAKRARNSGRAEYFRRAGCWSWVGVFRSRMARRAWDLHAEGVPLRDIVHRLGPMRSRQQRRVLDVIKDQRVKMALYPELTASEAPTLTAHAAALEAEGFGFDGRQRPARATPIVDLDRAFRRNSQSLQGHYKGLRVWDGLADYGPKGLRHLGGGVY